MPEVNLMPFVYFHKKIVPVEEAKIGVASHSLQYGTTCFGGIRGFVANGKVKVFRLSDHYERMHNAIKILGMKTELPWKEFEQAIVQIIQANAPQTNFYMRPFFYSEDPVLGPSFDTVDFKLAIYMLPLGDVYDPSKGLRLLISSWRKFADVVIPTKAKAGGGYVNSALAKTEARQRGYDDALMMDEQGVVVEATVANLFLVWRGKVLMPEIGSAVLEGITQRTMIEFLEEEGMQVRTARIDRSMTYTCDELILTGTAIQIAFVESVDGRIVAKDGQPGPICQLLRKKFKDVLEGKHPKSSVWLTEISII